MAEMQGTRVLSSHYSVLPWEETTMRWKISHHGHDPRQVDLLAIIALLIVIVMAWIYFADSSPPPTASAFIVPGQSVRW
jgi:hypothetical protein